MMPYLIENAPQRWTKVPNREDLEVLATKKMDVPCLGFRKNNKKLYVDVFCNEFMDPGFAMIMVINLYKKFNFGKPKFLPYKKNWIHTIPIPGPSLNESEDLLIHQITQSLFWTIYMDYKRDKEAKA